VADLWRAAGALRLPRTSHHAPTPEGNSREGNKVSGVPGKERLRDAGASRAVSAKQSGNL